MLTRRWRPGIALLAVAGLVSLAALPAAPALDAAAAPADGIQAKQQWVLNMLNTEAAWSVTRGAGVTVAVIDSGVNPDVSDLSGSVANASLTFNVHTPTEQTFTPPVRIKDYHQNEWGAFFKDDWKIRRNLTLNLGLRYELQTPPTDPSDRMSIFDPAAGFFNRVYLLLVILWSLATWALFGGAITRIAAVQVARTNERVGLMEAAGVRGSVVSRWGGSDGSTRRARQSVSKCARP